MEIKEAIHDYIYHIKLVDQKALTTISSYESDLQKYYNYLLQNKIKHVEDIDYDTIQSFLLELSVTLQSSTVNRYIVSIRNFHNFVSEQNDKILNPTIFIKSSKLKKYLPNVLNQDEVNTILNYQEAKQDDSIYHQCILELLYGCGLRVSELCDLTMIQLHLKEQIIKVRGKGDKERLVPLNTTAVNVLEFYITTIRKDWNKRKLSYVFVNHLGNRLTRQYVDVMIRKRANAVGINKKVSAHSFRHSFASHLLDGDADLRVVQELLGHSDISTTQIYTHVQTKRLKSVYLNSHPRSKRKEK